MSKVALAKCLDCLQQCVSSPLSLAQQQPVAAASRSQEIGPPMSSDQNEAFLLDVYRMWQHCVSVKLTDAVDRLRPILVSLGSARVS